jgi:hypothetical protein
MPVINFSENMRVGERKLEFFRIAPVSFVRHPQYNPSTQDYDYAIITLRYVVSSLLFIPSLFSSSR